MTNRASHLFLTLGVLFLFIMIFGPDATRTQGTSTVGPARGPSSIDGSGEGAAAFADRHCKGPLSRKTAEVSSEDGTVGYKGADLKVGFAQIIALTHKEQLEHADRPAKLGEIKKLRADALCRQFDPRYPKSRKFETSRVLDGPVFDPQNQRCLDSSGLNSDRTSKAETRVFTKLVCAGEGEEVDETLHSNEAHPAPIQSPSSVQ